MAGRRIDRIQREDAVDLDLDLLDVAQRSARREQAGECRMVDRGQRHEDEVIGRLDLDLAQAKVGRPRRRTHESVRKSSAERERLRITDPVNRHDRAEHHKRDTQAELFHAFSLSESGTCR